MKDKIKEANILLDKAEEILKRIVVGTNAWKVLRDNANINTNKLIPLLSEDIDVINKK